MTALTVALLPRGIPGRALAAAIAEYPAPMADALLTAADVMAALDVLREEFRAGATWCEPCGRHHLGTCGCTAGELCATHDAQMAKLENETCPRCDWRNCVCAEAASVDLVGDI